MITSFRTWYYFCWILGLVCSTLCNADPRTLRDTQDKLKQLDTQIVALKQNLSHSQDKKGSLNHELAQTAKEISDCVLKSTEIQHVMQINQQNIAQIQHRVDQLNQDLHQQQQSLAQHIRARYKLGEYQPLIMVLDQNNPEKISQLLTYYQYLIRSRQVLIKTIFVTEQKLASEKTSLQSQISEQQQLQKDLQYQQQTLQQRKHYQQVVMSSVDTMIRDQQHTLSDFEQNKLSLSKLLNSLAHESVAEIVTPKLPFEAMRHKLAPPIIGGDKAMHPMNQGVIFYAIEGTPVRAVYPGRVVFSDWLNGYGLLLIIDHGKGFMTLYAHNQSLFKSKGSMVHAGEQIATIGHSGGDKKDGLYFEVRQRGKAVSPLAWIK